MNLIRKYFPELTPIQVTQFDRLGNLYAYWNTRINVISRKDLDYLYERHVLHSLAIAKIFHYKPGTRIIDVGTGGGFPGIPLAIFFPECSFTLIDSVGKKILVVRSVAEELALTNVKIIQIRIENYYEKFNFVVARAVTQFPGFFKWVMKNVMEESPADQVNGIIYLKGGYPEQDLKPFRTARIINISGFFDENFFQTKKIIFIPVSDFKNI